MVAEAVNEPSAGAEHWARTCARSLREWGPRRSTRKGNGHPVVWPPRAPTAELAEGPPPASPFAATVVLGKAGAGTQPALGVLAGRVALFMWVVLTADEDARVPTEQLAAHVGKVSAGNRPTPLAAVPPDRSIASDPAQEFPLVLPHRVSRKPNTEPPFGGQADGRQVLTPVTRHPAGGLEVLGLLPPITPVTLASTRHPSAASSPGPPLDRYEPGELTGGMAEEMTQRPVMRDHAAVLVDLDEAAAPQARAAEPSVAHEFPLVCAASPASGASTCWIRAAPRRRFEGEVPRQHAQTARSRLHGAEFDSGAGGVLDALQRTETSQASSHTE
jgi:hypothetical protein